MGAAYVGRGLFGASARREERGFSGLASAVATFFWR
jgi:hypothetical protein